MDRETLKNDFLRKAFEKHGDRYDYSKVDYINSHTEVCIICKQHGPFWRKPYQHITGYGCQECDDNKKLTYNKFIKRAKEKHGDKYDYSKVSFDKITDKITIICPLHGEFKQVVNDHLQGNGCQKCAGKYKINQEEFIEQAKKVHGNKYDYSKVIYINKTTKVCIICPEHGEFWQAPKQHLRGENCPYCSNRVSTKDFFIYKAQKKHGNKYDYNKVNYVNSCTKVKIYCNKCGRYFWQDPASHLRGDGCPHCKKSKLENGTKCILENKNVEYISNYKPKWLNGKEIDLYIPSLKIGFECQGKQHFKPNNYFGGIKKFYEQVTRDCDKNKQCMDNGIRLFYIVEDKRKLVTDIDIYKWYNVLSLCEVNNFLIKMINE